MFGFRKKKVELKEEPIELFSMAENAALKKFAEEIMLKNTDAEKEKLKKARVFVAGCSGIGIATVRYLAQFGIGTIGMIDNAFVDKKDVQRQLFAKEQLGRRKVFLAADAVAASFSNTKVIPSTSRLRNDLAINLLKTYDIFLDCSNDIPTHYLLSDACILLKKSVVYAA